MHFQEKERLAMAAHIFLPVQVSFQGFKQYILFKITAKGNLEGFERGGQVLQKRLHQAHIGRIGSSLSKPLLHRWETFPLLEGLTTHLPLQSCMNPLNKTNQNVHFPGIPLSLLFFNITCFKYFSLLSGKTLKTYLYVSIKHVKTNVTQ